MNTAWLWIVLLFYVLLQLFRHLLDWLNIRHMRARSGSVPPEFEGVVDAALLQKSQDYLVDQTRLAALESGFVSLVILFLFFGGLLAMYSSWVGALPLSWLVAGWLFFLLLYFAEQILGVPWNLIRVFRLERRYGFTTTSAGLWIVDLAKETVISGLVISGLVISGLWLVSRSPGLWWIWFWLVFLGFSIVITYISPYVIEPLFNKFTPLEEPALREAIVNLAAKAGINAQKVLKMDASRRSKHSNAYFTGLGRAKRVVLYDTLLDGMTDAEVLAVLAHEIGHWKRHHVLINLVVLQLLAFTGLYAVFRLSGTGLLAALFGVETDIFFSRVLIAAFLLSMPAFLLRPLITFVTRRMERTADRLSVSLTGDAAAMISALVKLSKDNLSNPYPHPLYVAFYYSHPPVLDRIRALKGYQPSG